MRRTDQLIDQVRRYLGQQSFTDSKTNSAQIGLQTRTILDLLNEAQNVAHGIIYANAPAYFVKTDTIDIAADTESYTLPTDAFVGANIISVEYKYGSDAGDYRKLTKLNPHERDSSVEGTPYYYVQHKNNILLNPVPTTAVTSGIRVTYEYRLPDLDIRRDKISAVDSTTNPTSVTGDASLVNTSNVIFASGDAYEYLTVIDKDGNIQMDEIAVTTYTEGTQGSAASTYAVTVSASASEAVAVNDYIVAGRRATTHSELPDFAESFLITYVQHAIMQMIGHPMLQSEANKLANLTSQLADVMADWNADIMHIPRTDDRSLLDLEGYW